MISLVFAQTCPFGIVNDSYPGSCGRYVDVNNDGYCDLSETEIQTLNQDQNIPVEPKTNFHFFTKYNLLPLSLVLIILYLISLYLVKKQKLSQVINKKIWNLALLISFIITAITSILYLLYSEFQIKTIDFAVISFWHIELGLIMILISIFHALWHLSYFKAMLKLNN
jgi:hypothetical protein